MKKTVYFFKKQNFAAGGKGRASFDMAFRDRRGRRRFPKSEKEEEKSVFWGARLGSIFSALGARRQATTRNTRIMLVFALKC